MNTGRRRRTGGSRVSARRLFAVYAAASLLPVLALGAVLLGQLRSNGVRDGLAEARNAAALLARSAIQPQLTHSDLANGLTGRERRDLARTVRGAVAGGVVLRLRVRDLRGDVIFSDDGSGLHGGPVEDEVLDAAHGEVVSQLTHLNADSDDVGPAGPAVVEIYRPLRVAGSPGPVGVLEVYVPYEPIASRIAAQQEGLVIGLAGGLGALWLILLAISASVTRRLSRQLRRTTHLARHDQLTGLPNRGAFAQRIADRIDAQRPFGVALLDLDDFRQVNDVLGHANGDALLQELTARLLAELQSDETLARLGGDEFGILVAAGTDAAAGARLARLRQQVCAPAVIDDVPLVVAASVGYALFPDDGLSAATLGRHADLAMHAAKEHQLALVRYGSEHDVHDAGALALIGELRRALDEDELVLHYQPKGDLASGAVHEVEALVRWQHPGHGLLFPDAFIPLAERTELIDDLLCWVTRRAARELRDHADVSVAVNVSARSLVRSTTAERLLRLLAEEGMDPRRVIVEITETALMSDPVAAEITLGRLHDAGIRIAIDDFGAGQTSLGYLATLPVNELKIDKSFVMPMLDQERTAAIVRSVVELGHGLGCAVTAEGVETAAVLDRLRRWGCDTGQGFLLARPAPIEALGDAVHRAGSAMQESLALSS